MTNEQIAHKLILGGRGGFMAVLGDAYCRADSGNRARIEQAFPHVFDADPRTAPTHHIIVKGNVVEGFEFIGPFPSNISATNRANDRCYCDWRVIDLQSPDSV